MELKNNTAKNDFLKGGGVVENYTEFEKIYKLFLNMIQDYSLTKMFEFDPETAEDMLETFLIMAIAEFEGYNKLIANVNLKAKCFSFELTISEMVIMARIMVMCWLDRVINDLTQINLKLQDNDFKHSSENANLKEKLEYADRWREKVYQQLMTYALKTPLEEWGI